MAAQQAKSLADFVKELAMSRKAGFVMLEIDAGKKVSTVKQVTSKAPHKKKTLIKSKSGKKKSGPASKKR